MAASSRNDGENITQSGSSLGDVTAAVPDEAGFTTLAQPLSRPSPSAPTALQAAFCDSRFRPRQLHAQGGLGEVYVADDVELGRAVALKRIRDGRVFQAEDEMRFRREAEITGRLEHPGIVPIYGLGADATGKPFYAMRFIEGETFAAAISAFHKAEQPNRDRGERTLAFRHLLSHFMATCHAVAFAHARGIIHRDIKPANVMLGHYGETLVVDWGLAKQTERDVTVGQSDPQGPQTARSRPVATDGRTLAVTDSGSAITDNRTPTGNSTDSATVAGTVLGTPAFMSPEQATGQWDVVGPASDIFSLGAMLYQLLTGRPPYRGELTLDDAIHGHYLAPHCHNSEVPPELEAITLKAMARRPAERYPSAQALAADIEKWLGQEPVSVYREPWSKRVGRWGRRHQTLVTAVGVALLVAIVVMGVGSIWLNEARHNEQSAKREAQSLADEATLQRDEARAKYKLARRAVDDMLTAVSEQLRSVQDVPAVRKVLLQQALDFYQQFLQEKSDDPTVQRETAGAFARAAEIHQLLGDSKQAEANYLESVRLLTGLVGRESVTADRSERGIQNFRLGHLYFDLIRYGEAEKRYLATRDEFAQLVEQFPAERRFRDQLAGAVHNLARVYSSTGRSNDSEAAYRQALEMRSALAKADPAIRYLDGLARTQYSLASLLQSTAKRAEAEVLLNHAVAAFRQLSSQEPGNLDHRTMLASSIDGLGTILAQSSRFDEAAKTLAEALALREKLVAEQPSIPDLREGLGYTLQNITWLNRARGNAVEAEKMLSRGLVHWEKLAADFPAVPGYRGSVADSLNQLGLVLGDLNRIPEAMEAIRRAQQIYQSLIDKHPENPWFVAGLARSNNDLGILEQEAKNWPEAESHYRKSLALRELLVARSPNDLDAANELGGAFCNLGNLNSARVQFPAALEWYDKAIRVLSTVHSQRPKDPTTRRFLTFALWNRAKALAALGRHADSLPDWDHALELAPDSDKAAIQIGKAISVSKAANSAAQRKYKPPL